MRQLFYIHDPMCSWCWGFRPTWLDLQARLPAGVTVRKVLGGLAADTDQAMPADMRQRLQDTWRRIAARIPGTEFNFDFWTQNVPRRATYPACRAVLAAERLASGRGDDMVLAIQRAYYTRALNPSDDAVLTRLAGELGLAVADFAALLNGPEVAADLDAELALGQRLGVGSFPSLVLDVNGSRWPVGIEYTDADAMLDEIAFLLDGD